jgi:hypothetical protein
MAIISPPQILCQEAWMDRVQESESQENTASSQSVELGDIAASWTRRGLLTGMTGVAASSAAKAQGPVPFNGPATRVRRDDLYYLVNRGSFGYTPELYAEGETRGYDGWLDWQLDHASIQDPDVDVILSGYPTLSMTYRELYLGYGPNGNLGENFDVARALTSARIERAVKSNRQLYERIVDFWADHLNVPQNDNPLRLFRTVYDREVIREHALGHFPDMLMASAKSAGMLMYLNGNENVAGAPNENYAREVMELHTLGVDGGYNENDIRELARCFTGWTFFPQNSSMFGEFRFDTGSHDFGSKQVLGQTIPAGGGVSDGEFMLNYLAMHPTTAEYISKELATYLLDYDPPQELVDEAKAMYLATSGDMKEVVRVILDKRWIPLVGPHSTPKLRRPMHFVSNILRTPGVVMLNVNSIILALDLLGQRPFDWSSPDGYPNDLETWGSGVLPRWSFAFYVFLGTLPGVTVTTNALYQALGSPNLSNITARAAELLAGGNIDPDDLRDIDEFVQSGAATTGEALMRNTLALVASCPSYQYL